MFEPVDPRASFSQMELRILDFWRDARIFEKSLELRKGGPEWVFYEGPPTANGRPGIHHVEARTFKDVYPRFKTMTGHFVPRKAGWDCHGLPVELEVEKEIGTRTKSDIEAFGIAEFARLCRESVTRYVADWEKLTERIGFWINLEDAYWTMDTEYVESVWWSLKRLHQRGLLFEADKVTAYCPRCGTALSDAEVALGYAEVEDPSLFVKLRVTGAADESLIGARIAVWTTTPWTLLSNLGLAVSAEADYVEVEQGGERLIVADVLRERALPGSVPTGRSWKGAQMAGTSYEPPYRNVEGGSVHTVVTAAYVSLDDGTGVVHIAPAFGAEDLDVGRENAWPTYNPVDAEGRFTSRAPEFVHGRFVKDADPHIIEDLDARGMVIRAETLLHNYPLCWRCKTPLIYYARTSWYVGTTAKRDRLIQVNGEVNWYPHHIREGRFGNWLENNVDWALSRERYWGTPLPLWRCAEGHVTAVGSLTELSELAGRDVTDVDPHRPAIDAVSFACPQCEGTAHRVTEVIDTWYDSGAMPFAQWGYHPELGRGLDEFREHFPADFISEAIDQTRGWFYTLMAEAVLLFDDTSFRNVVCLGHLIAGDGRKMSKSLGNVIDPWTVLDRQGADALRWFLLTGGSPWASRRISPEILDDVVRQFLLTIWNVYSFFVTYANADGFDPGVSEAIPLASRPLLDRWILSQLADTVQRARDGLETYDATGVGRRIAAFVDDLSNWYVRRSRRRFWDPARAGEASEKLSAYQTLHHCLLTMSQLLAPFVPFLSEEMWRNLAANGSPESVHLSDYPVADVSAVDEKLDEAMSGARTIVSLGRTIRNDAKMKVRQPLLEAVVHYPGDPQAIAPLLPMISEELNVKEVLFAESAEQLAGWKAKPNFRALGPRLGPKVKDLAAKLAEDDGALAGALARGEGISVDVGGETVELAPADVELSQDMTTGWGVAAEGGLTVALDLELDEDLRLEGLAREAVRLIQDARKERGFDVSDRIRISLQGDDRLGHAIERHADYISGETLAVSLSFDTLPPGEETPSSIDGTPVGLELDRA